MMPICPTNRDFLVPINIIRVDAWLEVNSIMIQNEHFNDTYLKLFHYLSYQR